MMSTGREKQNQNQKKRREQNHYKKYANIAYTSTSREYSIKVYVGGRNDGGFVDCIQMSDVGEMKRYGKHEPTITGLLVKHSNGELMVEDHNRVQRSEACFIGKKGAPATQLTGFIQFGNNNKRHALVEYYGEGVWEEEVNIQKASSVRQRRVPNRDLSYSDTRDRYMEDMEISNESITTVSSIYQLLFPNQCDQRNMMDSVLWNDHTEELQLMKKLHLEEGADYEAFIVAKETWDAINYEKKAVRKFVGDIRELVRVGDMAELINVEGWITGMSDQFWCVYRLAIEAGMEDFMTKIARIRLFSYDDDESRAFMEARELLNSLRVDDYNTVVEDNTVVEEEGGGEGEWGGDVEEPDEEMNVEELDEDEGEVEEEMDFEESDEDDREEEEGEMNVDELDEDETGGEGEEEELYEDERTYNLIKQKKEKWKKEEDPQLHLMAKQFELNMMFEKLSGRRQGKVAKIMQAGHMGNLDEIFRVVPNPNKRKETRG